MNILFNFFIEEFQKKKKYIKEKCFYPLIIQCVSKISKFTEKKITSNESIYKKLVKEKTFCLQKAYKEKEKIETK